MVNQKKLTNPTAELKGIQVSWLILPLKSTEKRLYGASEA
jgi:hypothetical protein